MLTNRQPRNAYNCTLTNRQPRNPQIHDIIFVYVNDDHELDGGSATCEVNIRSLELEVRSAKSSGSYELECEAPSGFKN